MLAWSWLCQLRQCSRWVFVLILCSHVTLSIHALVRQMGSTMKPTMFNDLVVIYTVPVASMN
ncbi:hypothetical protein HanRHA438_Chr17g0815001 [Helianthus annuus]|nr:hypothetical protein HanRHA438_Chr17g0815001 [Helianthus annuus]